MVILVPTIRTNRRFAKAEFTHTRFVFNLHRVVNCISSYWMLESSAPTYSQPPSALFVPKSSSTQTGPV